MNITTKHTSNQNGRGQIVVTGTVDGKRRQKTVSYDHAISAGKNHGRAAAEFVRKTQPVDKWEHIAHSTTHTDHGNGTHTFSF